MRKVAISLIFVAIILIGGFYYYQPVTPLIKATQSAGGYPYQIGLTNAIIISCFTSCCAPVCTCCAGGTLCMTKDVATCTMYSDVSGSPAGGMGSNALFLNTAIAQAGLTPGGQLIAGGMTMTQMDSGVLASVGGCYGCMAKASLKDKIVNWFDKYIIAGIRGK